jgi:6-phosphogluconolactonase (cycloisomerase 2 family)
MHLKNIRSSNPSSSNPSGTNHRSSDPRGSDQRSAKAAVKMAAALAALSLAFGLTACTRDYTLAYLYVTTSGATPGVIDQFAVDYESGAIVQFGTPVATGNNPVASIAAPNAAAIYVVNQGDSTVQEFAVQSGGTLVSKNTYATTGNTPTAIAIDPAGKFLFVTCTYQGTNTTGAGAVSVFPINSDNSLGTAANVNVGNRPVGVTITAFNPTLYVVDQEPLTTPQVLAFAFGTDGSLTPVTGTTATTGFASGVTPSAIAEDPTGRYVYVTDKAANQLIGYVVQAGGVLLPMVNGPFTTGQFPVAVITDPRGEYVYVANYNSKSISAYAINTTTGTPSGVAGATLLTDPNPVSLALDPALGVYLYSANNLASTVSGQKLNPATGVLATIQNSPYTASSTPSSVVIVANGSHPTQHLLY